MPYGLTTHHPWLSASLGTINSPINVQQSKSYQQLSSRIAGQHVHTTTHASIVRGLTLRIESATQQLVYRVNRSKETPHINKEVPFQSTP